METQVQAIPSNKKEISRNQVKLEYLDKLLGISHENLISASVEFLEAFGSERDFIFKKIEEIIIKRTEEVADDEILIFYKPGVLAAAVCSEVTYRCMENSIEGALLAEEILDRKFQET